VGIGSVVPNQLLVHSELLITSAFCSGARDLVRRKKVMVPHFFFWGKVREKDERER